MNVILKFCVVLSIVQLGHCQVLPVDKCKLEDSACMTAAFQKAIPIFAGGLPDEGVDVMDVMDLDDLDFDLSGLQFSMKEGKLKGLKAATVDNVTWNTKKRTISVTFRLDCSVKGHYTAGGRLLILPITGDGQLKLKLKNVEIRFVLSYNMEKDAEGKDHAIPKKYTFDFDVKDNAHYGLTNLFNGNKELSDTMLKFLNENWKQVSTEFGRPLMDAAAKKIFKNVKAYLTKNAIGDIANV